ncbi:putative secreted protein [Sorangium cellulosum So ce56]|uniref:Secreted protein n=2 Tax=Sorangium cellulosum TaxID=56 RepID=A9GV55_SORC5|nr:putative secreted protein [Sorangium cellulosum So ce56]
MMRRSFRMFASVAGGLVASAAGMSAALAQVAPLDTNHVVIIDRSGSMYGDRLELAKKAAKIYWNTLVSSNVPASQSFTELLGVASYSDTSSVTYPLTALPASGLDTAVDALVADGSTSIGAGLEEALDMLISESPTKSARECVILLSDGQHNTPPAPSDFYADYFSRVDEVHSIALGSGADEAMMSDIAANYGFSPGLYLRADSDTAIDQLELIGAFNRMANDCRDGGMIDQGLTQIPPPSPQSPQSFACADTLVSAAQIVDFTMIFVGAAAPEVYLLPPWDQTSKITEANFAASGSDLTFFSAENFKRFSLNLTEAYEEGFWQFCAVNTSDQPIYVYSAVSTLADTISLRVTPSTLNVGAAPLIVEAEVSHLGSPVLGATVSAEMTGPSGAVTPLSFHDDGAAAHGDTTANDGVYSLKVGQFAETGSHDITVFADHAGSATVPMFTRQHTFGFYKNPAPPCQSLGPMSSAIIASVNGTSCFQIDRASLPTGWTPATLTLQMSPADGVPLNGVSVSANGGAPQSAPANSWSATTTIPFPGTANDVVYQVSTTSNRQLQIQWYP